MSFEVALVTGLLLATRLRHELPASTPLTQSCCQVAWAVAVAAKKRRDATVDAFIGSAEDARDFSSLLDQFVHRTPFITGPEK